MSLNTRKEVTIKLNDTEYRLKFDFDATALAERITGRAILAKVFAIGPDNLTIDFVRSMLFASVIALQPETTFEEISKAVNFKNFTEVWTKTMDVWRQDMTDPEATQAEESPNEQSQN